MIVPHPPTIGVRSDAAISSDSNVLPIYGVELSLVIPTFNERDNIAPLVERLRATLAGIAWEVIFVDDDSKDNTLDIVRDLSLRDRRVRGIRRIGRRGLAGACLEGILSSSAPVVAVMDADLQHDETRLSHMLDIMRRQQTDLVVATRYDEEGFSGDGLTRLRQAGSRAAIDLAQRLLRVHTSDPMSGFFMIRRTVVEAIAPQLSNQGFKILLDIIASAPTKLRIAEVPYVFRPRMNGESKLDAAVVFEYLGLLTAKFSGDLVSTRFLLFCLVGSIGVVVHLAMLRLLLLANIPFAAGQTIAMFSAVLSNYTLNNALTYRDRRRSGMRFVSGLLLYSSFCSLGIVGGVGISTLFYNHQSRWWIDGLAGAVIGAGWNYMTSSMLTWRNVR
jgi:dolichol-phosphate mannosyltransferase